MASQPPRTPTTSASIPQMFSAEYLAEDSSYYPRVVCGMSAAFIAIFAILRVWARMLLRKHGPDDWLMAISMLCAVIQIGLSFGAFHHGAGRHTVLIHPDDMQVLFKCLKGFGMTFSLSLWFCRVSGLAFYAQIAKDIPQHRNVLYVAWIVICSCSLTLFVLSCIGSQDLGNTSMVILVSVLIAVCDFTLYLLPILIIVRLNISMKQKIILAFVMCFGAFAVIISAFRIMATCDFVSNILTDPARYMAPLLLWSSAEMATTIMALNLPALKPLCAKLLSDPTSLSASFRSSPSEQPRPTIKSSNHKHTDTRKSGRFHHMKPGSHGQKRSNASIGFVAGTTTITEIVMASDSEEQLWGTDEWGSPSIPPRSETNLDSGPPGIINIESGR